MKTYLRTTRQLEDLVRENEISKDSVARIREKLGRIIGSRYLVLEISNDGVLMSMSDIEEAQVPIHVIPDKNIDSALYL